MEKFRIEVIDFMLEYGKHKTGFKDVDGVELCVGDTVERGQDHFLVGYRYGKFILKPPLTAHYLSLSDDSHVTKRSVVMAVPGEFLVIGMVDEPFYQAVKHLIPTTT